MTQPTATDTVQEEEQVRATVRRFAREVLRPAGVRLDHLHDPEDVVAPDSELWDVVARYERLGLDEPDAMAGLAPEAQVRMRRIITEELAAGDVGLAIVLGLMNAYREFVHATGDDELIERFGRPNTRTWGCWALTEPDHGSDVLAVSEPTFRDPSQRPNCVARRDGDDYLIHGQKAAWVSCAPLASFALVYCTLEGSRGFAGGAGFVVPTDLPGVQRGRALDKMGQRSLPQGELFFDEVRVPGRYLVVDPDRYPRALEKKLAYANANMGLLFSGLAGAAYEMALAYAQQRVQGGGPIIRHQSVQGRIFEMYRQVELARSLCREVYETSMLQRPRIERAIASKISGTQTSFDVASAAVQMHGANGVSREYDIEKIFRDARSSLMEDGANEVLALVGAQRLAEA